MTRPGTHANFDQAVCSAFDGMLLICDRIIEIVSSPARNASQTGLNLPEACNLLLAYPAYLDGTRQ